MVFFGSPFRILEFFSEGSSFFAQPWPIFNGKGGKLKGFLMHFLHGPSLQNWVILKATTYRARTGHDLDVSTVIVNKQLTA